MKAGVIIILVIALSQYTLAGIIDFKSLGKNFLEGVAKLSELYDPYAKLKNENALPPYKPMHAYAAETEALRKKVYPGVLEQESKHASNLNWVCELGSGGYGTVSLQNDTKTGELHAVKYQMQEYGRDERLCDFMNRCKREYECHYMCRRSPNVVKPKELVYSEKHNRHFMLIMEYCANGTLRDFVHKLMANDMDVNGTAYLKPYFKQLVSGLAQIHASGVAHRDIKPTNILVDCQGICKYADFGISRDVTRSSWVYGNRDGTTEFVAPEAYSFGGKFDLLKADVWALGITLYLMVTSKFPFRNAVDDPDYVMFRKSPDSLLGPSANRTAEFELIAKMLTINPGQRPSAIELLQDPYFE